MEKIHFEQAKLWLKAAIFISDREVESSPKFGVAITMLIHATIKANDALTLKFMNITARRHDDARRLFEDLIKKNLIKAEYASYNLILQDVISAKAKADYRGGFFSKKEFGEMKRKAEKFMKMAQEIIS